MASNSDRRSGSSARSSRDPNSRGATRGSTGTGRAGGSRQKRSVEINITREIAREGRSATGSKQQRQREAGLKGADSRTAPVRSDARSGRASRHDPRTGRAPRGDQTDLQRASRRVAAAKADERSRREALARRSFILKALAAVIVAALVVTGAVGIYRSSFLAVDTVRTAGNNILSDAHIVALAEVPGDATLLNIKTDEIVSRLLSDPYIKEARVDRNLPATLVLRVEERAPVAAFELADATYLVDDEGYWLSAASAEQTATLAVVRDLPTLAFEPGARIDDASARNAIAIVNGLSPELREITAYLNAPSVEKTEIITREGIAIFLGSSDQLAVKDEVARRILAENEGKVVYINVRIVDRPTWRGL